MQKLDILKMGNMYNLRPHSPSPTVTNVEPGIYNIQIDPEKGIFLHKVADKYLVPTKIWGKDNRAAIDTVVNTLNKRSTSMGTILSGTMGSGKTMTAECICNKIIAEGGVVIQVSSNYSPMLLESIRNVTDKTLVYYFPEFTTNYMYRGHRNPDVVDQAKMLEFFSNQTLAKSLFLLTLNEMNELSPMILNRPGRFLYHIRYVGIDSDLLTEVITDLKVNPIVSEWLYDYIRKLGRIATIDQVLEIIRNTRECTTESELSSVLKILNVYRSITRLKLSTPTHPPYQLNEALKRAVFNPTEGTLEVCGINGDPNEVTVLKIGQLYKSPRGTDVLVEYVNELSDAGTNFVLVFNNNNEPDF